jgi:uncharacterized cupin superfamily protein
MPSKLHVDDLQLKTWQDRVPQFSWHTSERLSERAGSQHLKFDVRSLDPGTYSFPYHFHRAAEELFVILAGEATLRTPQGFERVGRGDLLFFEQGPTGAHQLFNHASEPCLYVDVASVYGIDVCEYPDSGKIAIFPSRQVFETSAAVDYFKGEQDVAARWPK